MTQIGTMAFDAEKFCFPTTLTLTGTELPKDAPEALSAYTDGYKAEMLITIAQTMEAGSNASMCMMGDEAGNMICAVMQAGEDEGQMGFGFVGAKPRAEAMTPSIMGADNKPTDKDGKALTWWQLGDDQGVGSVPA
jgi:hypothetical protein